MKIDNQAVLDRFSGMIRFATVSNPDPEKMDYEEFYKFHRYLEETFPLIHQHLEKEVVSRASLLYRWKGDGSSNRLPIALIAHQDVVPVGEESQWEHGPFSGDIDDTYIWGRGTWTPSAKFPPRWRRWNICWPRVTPRPATSISVMATTKR